jgi:hypothetical protein
MGTVSDKGQNDYIRFSALSNAGYEPDGHKKTNQDAFLSFVEFGQSKRAIRGRFLHPNLVSKSIVMY